MTHSPQRIALCTHFSIEHYRGGEKWIVQLANHLASQDEFSVAIHAYPYAPGGIRRVDARNVLDHQVQYTEAWRHDLSGIDTAYVFYHPGAYLSFPGAKRYVAGIHSSAFVSRTLIETHYGILPTAAKLLFRLVGNIDLARYDVVHAVTPAFESDHPALKIIPNFVDTSVFNPGAGDSYSDFTVLVSAAHIPEKGWDYVETVAERIPKHVRLIATGENSHPNIEELGFLTEHELAAEYAKSHVVFHPARVDTDSMVINESCASGTPIVTSPIPTHIRENAGVIHAGTVREMVYWINHLYEEWQGDPGAYERRCEVAFESVQGHELSVVFPQLEQLLVGDSDLGLDDSVERVKIEDPNRRSITHV